MRFYQANKLHKQTTTTAAAATRTKMNLKNKRRDCLCGISLLSIGLSGIAVGVTTTATPIFKNHHHHRDHDHREVSDSTTGNTIQYEAEDANLMHNSQVRTDHHGYTGRGYVDYEDFGSLVEWNVNIAQSGYYRLSFRYSAKVSRPCTLIVDGISDNPIHFRETGEWDIWSVETLSRPIYLSQGTHTLGSLATASTGPNIDWMSLTELPHETLETDEVLNRGEYISSPSRQYRFGITNNDGRLVLLQTGATSTTGSGEPILWSANLSGIESCKMQGDGNLVCRDGNGQVAWTSRTTSSDGAHLVVSDAHHGQAMIELGENDLWTTTTTASSPPTPPPTPNQVSQQTPPPTPQPTPNPVNPPTPSPSPQPTAADPVVVIHHPANAAVVLEPNQLLVPGEFVYSPNGGFRLGLRSSDGEFVLETTSGTTIWSAKTMTHNPGTVQGQTSTAPVIDRLYMQDDGNLVIKDATTGSTLWISNTPGNFGANLLVAEDGKAVIVHDGVELWSTASENEHIVDNPPAAIALERNGFLELNQYVYSPNGFYRLGLRSDGELVLESSPEGTLLWSAGIIERYGDERRGFRCYLQDDGNLIVRDANLGALWSSQTSNNRGSYLVVNDGGQIRMIHEGVPIWIQGIPRGRYVSAPPSSQDMQFPIRGQFYYPWYPETWTVNNDIARFEPDLGYYNSGDPYIIEKHIDMLDYAHTDLSIASWWGPDTNLDKARLTLLMDKTIEMGSNMLWTVYHEDEFHYDASVPELKSELDYLKKWFAWHPAWAHIDGKPVIFVYNDRGCDVPQRWMEASNDEWYVVLKLFQGYGSCDYQPDSWHQYGPGEAVVRNENHSFAISPGFWRADIADPLLERVGREEFCNNVDLMVQSNEPWQLVTTFNEAGEGTMIEPSYHWASNSGYGFYLDCLHEYN